ncbi:glycosyltransferase family A protein [Alkalilimnicola ehrlichii]|uniref:glycosyltransferase family 2 protein n=1 Tax=Alkalilimnicola ehrlichii TaxID=351052 RepID=UPI000E2F6A8E|nr:glycosyltransferase family A protein [Alkalilimnicola ehrlichii]
MASIIIPAHNEAAVIERTLRTVVPMLAEEDELILVANGCTDDTAGIARRYEPQVRVIETDVASKPHALNLGDQAARSFPRIYLDADIELKPEALPRLKAALQAETYLRPPPTR